MNKRLSLLWVTVLGLCLVVSPANAADNTTIKGTTADSTAASLNVTNSSDTSLLYVRNDGVVGIGTSTPAEKLHISSGNILLDNNQNLKWKNTVGDVVNYIWVDAGNQLQVGTYSGSGASTIFNAGTQAGVMIIKNTNGYVGIGTTAPNDKLQVRLTTDENFVVTGHTTLTSGITLKAANDAYNNVVPMELRASSFDFTGGNVGIGTTSPSQELALVGDIMLENTTSDDTGVIYKGSDRFIHNFQHPTGGSAVPVGRNTFVGIKAGNFTSGSTATQTYHASYNTGVGYESLYGIGNGSWNTAIGYQSLYTGGLSSYNVAVGYQTLYSNTTGAIYNVAVGYKALYANQNGYNNAAVGAFALSVSTGAHRNTAVGYSALCATINGQNTAVGSNALNRVTYGESNTAIGNEAGNYIADGSTGNLRPSYSVYLGANTKALVDSGQNEIVIGYNATGLGSNTVVLGNSSITTTALRGNVGIGTTSPSGILDVSSTSSAFLPPRMTTAEKAAIASPVEGMVVYDTTLHKLSVYTGSTWETVTSS